MNIVRALLATNLLTLAACQDSPPSHRPDRDFSYSHGKAWAGGPDDAAYWMSELVSDFGSGSEDTYPLGFKPLDHSSGCHSAAASPEQKVYIVHGGNVDVGFGFLSSSELDRLTKWAGRFVVYNEIFKLRKNKQLTKPLSPVDYAKLAVRSGAPPTQGASAEEFAGLLGRAIAGAASPKNQRAQKFYAKDSRVGLVDIVVTDTSKPVHLVLLNSKNKVFNFHVAPGVNLERVVAVDAQDVSFANLPKGTSVTTIVGTADMRRCGLKFARKPPANFGAYLDQRDPSGKLRRESLAMEMSGYRLYETKKNQLFGRQGLVDFQARHSGGVLVGPPPSTLEQRLPYTSLEESVVYTTTRATIVAGDRGQQRRTLSRMVKDRLAKNYGEALAAKWEVD